MTQGVVQIIFIRDSKILLGFRQNTDFLDQLWGFPAGRIELGEQPQASALRESLEEVAVEPINLSFLTKLSDPNVDCQHYVYTCDDWKGEIKNAEPHLCREVRWFDIEYLPTDCTPTTQSVIVELRRYLATAYLI